MQKIRKILKVFSEKAVLPTNQPTNQPIITNNTDLIGPRWSRSKKVFLKISQNSQENTFTRASFLIKLQAWRPQLY